MISLNFMPGSDPAANPSRRVTRHHYAEQFDWWAASGLTLEIKEEPGGGLSLTTPQKGGQRSWGAYAEASELHDPMQVRLFLVIALYLRLHPRKAQASYAAIGLFCSDKELTAFVRALRRKVKKLLSSQLANYIAPVAV